MPEESNSTGTPAGTSVDVPAATDAGTDAGPGAAATTAEATGPASRVDDTSGAAAPAGPATTLPVTDAPPRTPKRPAADATRRTAARRSPASNAAKPTAAAKSAPAVASVAPAQASVTARTPKRGKPVQAVGTAESGKPAKTGKADKEAKAVKVAKVVKPSKPAGKSAPSVVAAPVQVAAPVAAAHKPPRSKEKLVRDSFTMPRSDFALIQQLKDRAMGFRHAAKKSELLRAGLHALARMDTAALQALLGELPTLKSGRPRKAG